MKLKINLQNVPAKTNHIDLLVDDVRSEFDAPIPHLLSKDNDTYEVFVGVASEYKISVVAMTEDYQELSRVESINYIENDFSLDIQF